jgi:hypothetical protein
VLIIGVTLLGVCLLGFLVGLFAFGVKSTWCPRCGATFLCPDCGQRQSYLIISRTKVKP